MYLILLAHWHAVTKSPFNADSGESAADAQPEARGALPVIGGQVALRDSANDTDSDSESAAGESGWHLPVPPGDLGQLELPVALTGRLLSQVILQYTGTGSSATDSGTALALAASA